MPIFSFLIKILHDVLRAMCGIKLDLFMQGKAFGWGFMRKKGPA